MGVQTSVDTLGTWARHQFFGGTPCRSRVYCWHTSCQHIVHPFSILSTKHEIFVDTVTSPLLAQLCHPRVRLVWRCTFIQTVKGSSQDSKEDINSCRYIFNDFSIFTPVFGCLPDLPQIYLKNQKLQIDFLISFSRQRMSLEIVEETFLTVRMEL